MIRSLNFVIVAKRELFLKMSPLRGRPRSKVGYYWLLEWFRKLPTHMCWTQVLLLTQTVTAVVVAVAEVLKPVEHRTCVGLKSGSAKSQHKSNTSHLVFFFQKIFLDINNIASRIYLSISIETHNLITAIMFYKRSINSLSGHRRAIATMKGMVMTGTNQIITPITLQWCWEKFLLQLWQL